MTALSETDCQSGAAAQQSLDRRTVPERRYVCNNNASRAGYHLFREISSGPVGINMQLILVLTPKGDTIQREDMVSQHYKNWLSIEDERQCKPCKEMHGKVYEIGDIPNPEPPLHENCRCYIAMMKAVLAGKATSKGKTGADWWLLNYGSLPPYYITKDEARELGWKTKKANLAIVAPNRMLTKGEYRNDDMHLPMADGRKWYEADINYVSGRRNDERIIYSNDGLIFISRDHYKTFIEVIEHDATEE